MENLIKLSVTRKCNGGGGGGGGGALPSPLPLLPRPLYLETHALSNLTSLWAPRHGGKSVTCGKNYFCLTKRSYHVEIFHQPLDPLFLYQNPTWWGPRSLMIMKTLTIHELVIFGTGFTQLESDTCTVIPMVGLSVRILRWWSGDVRNLLLIRVLNFVAQKWLTRVSDGLFYRKKAANHHQFYALTILICQTI